MKTTIRLLITGAIAMTLVLAVPVGAFAAPNAGVSMFKSACEKTEKWMLTKELPGSLRRAYSRYFDGTAQISESFVDAIGAERGSKSDAARLASIYLKYRILLDQGLFHYAASGFNWIVSQPPNTDSFAFQLAAMDCLNGINTVYPRMHLKNSGAAMLPQHVAMMRQTSWLWPKKHILWETQALEAIRKVGAGNDASELVELRTGLAGSDYYLSWVDGLLAARSQDWPRAAAELENFMKKSKRNKALRRFRNTTHMALARVYYNTGEFKKANTELSNVNKDSNEMIRAVSELSWVYLMGRHNRQAVGAALTLQGGQLRATFTPEALIVMSMSYAEFCQYPASYRMVKRFHRKYRSTFAWLDQWARRQKAGGYNENHMKHVIYYLEEEKSKIPFQILSEWMRSPVFITNQQEINLLGDEMKASGRMMRALREHYRVARSSGIRELKEQARDAKDAKDRKAYVQALKDLKRAKRHVANAKESVAAFRRMGTAFRNQRDKMERDLVREVNSDLGLRNRRMLARLKEMAEFAYLIQVELYDRASEEMIWNHANPQFAGFAEEVKSRSKIYKSERYLNWGSAYDKDTDRSEVWEDELGNLKVDLQDICSARERYIASIAKKRNE